MKKMLELGYGGTPRQEPGYEWHGIDILDNKNIINAKSADLNLAGISWPDNTFDLITSHDFLEHLVPAVYVPSLDCDKDLHLSLRYPLIELMNESYRVLKHDGLFRAQVPLMSSWGGISDPTHVNFWRHEKVNYLSGDYFGHHDSYGHTSRFETMNIRNLENGVHMEFTLRAIKNVDKDLPYLLRYT